MFNEQRSGYVLIIDFINLKEVTYTCNLIYFFIDLGVTNSKSANFFLEIIIIYDKSYLLFRVSWCSRVLED